jgi:hypothetical protein
MFHPERLAITNQSHLIPATILLRITAALIVLIASSVAFLFVVINRHSQVRERLGSSLS